MDSSRRPPLSTGYVVRQATVQDIPHLGAIESSAGNLFHTVSLSAVAGDAPMSQDRLLDMCKAGNLTVVALSSNDEPVAFLAAHEIATTGPKFAVLNESAEGTAKVPSQQSRYLHIAELSTHTQHQRQGLASALMNSLISDGQQSAYKGLTLTTYRDVAFNGPFYQRFGFHEVEPQSVGVEFETLVSEELSAIHEPSRRCFMLKELS